MRKHKIPTEAPEGLLEIMQELVDQDRELEIVNDVRALYYYVCDNTQIMDDLLALRHCNASKLNVYTNLYTSNYERIFRSKTVALIYYYYFVFSCRYNNFKLLELGYDPVQACLARVKPLSRAPRVAQKHQAKLFKSKIKGLKTRRFSSDTPHETAKNLVYMGSVMLCTGCIHPMQLRGLYKQTEFVQMADVPTNDILDLICLMTIDHAPDARKELEPFVHRALALLKSSLLEGLTNLQN